MVQGLLGLLSARKGHFRLESGYHAEFWFDLDPLFVVPSLVLPYVEELANKLEEHNLDAVCGSLVGGAFLAQSIASLLGIEFYYAERLPPRVLDDGALFPVGYSIPAGVGRRLAGKVVAVVDDAISAGSAVRGTLAALEANGAKPVAVAALLVLGGQAAEYCREHRLALESVAQLPYEVWLPGSCPLCAQGARLEPVIAP
jgi:orotate phosphoribosyltransferase